jgi:hypothetical protein
MTTPAEDKASRQAARLMYDIDRARRALRKGQTRKASGLIADSADLGKELLRTIAEWQTQVDG